MKKIICFICIYICLKSCSSITKQANFLIINKNNTYITDIKISNGVNETYKDTIKANMDEQFILDFKGVPKVDGGYKLTYKLNSKSSFINFGYYSNGVPTNSVYILTVEKDTIIVREKMK